MLKVDVVDFGAVTELLRADTSHPIDSHLETLSMLTRATSLLSQQHYDVVDAVLGLSWATSSSELFVITYVAFIENLVSANSYFIHPCLRMLVRHFSPPRGRTSSTSSRLSAIFMADRALCEDRVHLLLSSILQLVPASSSYILPLLTDHFPSKHEDIVFLEYYTKNLLRLLSYAPTVREHVLALLVEHLVQLDIEIQGEIDELDDDALEMVQDTIFNIHPDSLRFDMDEEHKKADDSDPLISSSSEAESIEIFDEDDDVWNTAPVVSVRLMVKKLDTLMSLVLNFLKDEAATEMADSMSGAYFNSTFYFLLLLFEKFILTTHRSRHVQFIIFYFSSLHPSLSDQFLGFLASRIFDPHKSLIERQSCASYLASYVARSKFLELSSIVSCFDLLLPWLHAYVEDAEKVLGNFSVNGNEVNRHALFYSVCQAVMYIVCFKHKMLEEKQHLKRLFLDRIVHSRLNPLAVCSQSVVNEFARITRQYEVVYCYGVLEKNKRLLRVEKFEVETFFPFDPLRLKLSSVYVENMYQIWEENVDESENDEDDIDRSVGVDDAEMTMMSEDKKFVQNEDLEESYLAHEEGNVALLKQWSHQTHRMVLNEVPQSDLLSIPDMRRAYSATDDSALASLHVTLDDYEDLPTSSTPLLEMMDKHLAMSQRENMLL